MKVTGYANDNLSSTCGEKPSSNHLTGQIQGKQTILEAFKCEESVNLAHYFPYDLKLRLLAHSRSF